MPALRMVAAAWMLLGLAVPGIWAGQQPPVPPQATPASSIAEQEIERRLAEMVQYLTSEQLEGRGVGTKGLDLAAEYIGQQFAQAGLKTKLYQDAPFQKFVLSRGAKLGTENRLRLVGPPAKPGGRPQVLELRLGEDYTPMSLSGTGEFDLPLVFAGYSISAPEANYDDYADLNVRDKAVLVLRHEPQQANPQSPFAGLQYSEHAQFSRKVANARQRGAKAVLICSDWFDLEKATTEARKKWYELQGQLAQLQEEFKKKASPTAEERQAHQQQVQALQRQLAELQPKLQPEYDPLMPFETGPPPVQKDEIPVLYCRRAVVEPMVELALGKDLATIEAEIDKTLKPQSRPLEGWRLIGRVDIQRQSVEVKNVVGLIEAQGPLARQHIILGAHYDHLGYGGLGSLQPFRRVVHPGADDNASGVAVMVEAARLLAARKDKFKRSVLCIAFTAEERGLVGSRHYIQNPLWPLDQCIAMINLDMVGRLQNDRLTIMGVGTAKQFEPLLDRLAGPYGLVLRKVGAAAGPSDHTPFYLRRLPVLHFFTGIHGDYHRPTDTADKLNIAGMRRIAQLVADVVEALATAAEVPEYVASAGGMGLPLIGGGNRPFLGTVPDFGRQADGYAIAGVVPGSPAEKAGLQPGDLIVQFNDQPIKSLADIEAALRKHKPGEKVRLRARRGSELLEMEVTLAPRN
ncbi:MAG: M20/M25/M40 family metallo-hydrolase [Thermoguttaceae bacterium]|nr:M20/M25/M40 family metallo-hydrolase [Thermoguttaceae bacterium]MDW8039494.1 M20/M25/M40 family metallo-hydrolase [Thermoguttaceae bacterium]